MYTHMTVAGKLTKEIQFMNAFEWHVWEFGLLPMGAVASFKNIKPNMDTIRFVF